MFVVTVSFLISLKATISSEPKQDLASSVTCSLVTSGSMRETYNHILGSGPGTETTWEDEEGDVVPCVS